MTRVDQQAIREVDGIRVRMLHTTPPTRGGLPVLVLHGWGASLEAVRSVTSGLAGHAEVVALDLPGFGESQPPPGAWSNGDYANFVLKLADELGLERFNLLGHSRGAAIALVLADEHPERVGRLLLTGAAGIRPRRHPRYYARVAVAKLGRVLGAVGGPPGKRLQERLRRRVGSADWLAAPEWMRGTLRTVLAEDVTPRLSRIKASTLLIWGERDEDTPLWMAERMEKLIPDAGLVVLDGAGHFAYAERASEFNRIAVHFLAAA